MLRRIRDTGHIKRRSHIKKKRMVLHDALLECARDMARNIIVPLGLPKLLIGENHRQITLVGVLRTEGRRTDNHSYRHRLPSSN